MKKQIFKYIFAASALFSLSSCSDLVSLNVNPNEPETTTPALLLTHVTFDAFSDCDKSFSYINRMLVQTDGNSSNQNYTWTRGSFGDYSKLRDVIKMVEVADENSSYVAIAKFLQAHYLFDMSMRFGDIPYSEALRGETDLIYYPIYDTQEDVIEGALIALKEADEILADATDVISGDVVFDGDTTKWRKLINAYRLRILMTMSNKTMVGSVNVISEFASVYNAGLLMESINDNGQLVFLDQQDNRYEFFNDSDFGSGMYMDDTYIQNFVTRSDNRLFAIVTQTPNALIAGLAVDDFSSYAGGDPTVAYSLNNDKAAAGDCGKSELRYYTDPTNEPMILLGYTEQQLIIAEAIVRGWITGDAKEYYDLAVKASFEFYRTHASSYSSYLTEAEAEIYLAGSEVILDSSLSEDEKIERIIMQKYLPSFLQGSNWLVYFDAIRTGYPEFALPSGVSTLPYRWIYPQNKYDNNRTNVDAAVASQYAGNDAITSQPWWTK